MIKQHCKLYLFLEFTILFLLLPIIMYLYRGYLRFFIIPFLLGATIWCLWVLLRDPSFHRVYLWHDKDLFYHIKRSFYLFIPGAIVLTIFLFFHSPEYILRLPREKTIIWIIIIFLYPILSAYPQEVIYRVFFFHRYQGIFPTPTSMIIVNSLCFSWAHILFANWIILFLTLFGGILFALRYHRYKSLTHIFFEHSLWGNWLFTIGYAHYFQGGSIGQYFQ